MELLLTLVLILCLAAASVFSYTALHRQANLDEGVDRLATVLRFARAEAATTGKKVRVQFVKAEAGLGEKTELKQIKVEWEPDALKAPGVFEAYTGKTWDENIVNELVSVEKVEAADAAPAQSRPGIEGEADQPAEQEISEQTSTDEAEAVEEAGNEIQPITFYPDGTCDSAKIVVTSKNEDDPRRMAVTVSGLLGVVSTKLVTESNETNVPGLEDFEADWEASTPATGSGQSKSQTGPGEFTAF